MSKAVSNSELISEQQLDSVITDSAFKDNEWLPSKKGANKYQEMIPYMVDWNHIWRPNEEINDIIRRRKTFPKWFEQLSVDNIQKVESTTDFN
jgi:hypothetical protein